MVENLVILFLFIVGLCLGSFLNVLVYRLPRKRSLLWPPSSCPHCQHRLAASDLIPLVSHLWLKGRCRYCQQPISLSYFMIELITGIFTVVWVVHFRNEPGGELWRLFLGYLLIVIAIIDLKTYLIPNDLIYPALLGGLIYRWSQGELQSALIGALVGGGLLFSIYLLYPKGMGMGDIKLLTLLGVFLGGYGVLQALFWSSLSGVIILVPLVLSGRIRRQQPVPFAPFLALGTFVVLFWG
ncbi:MAG: prepilin peptidase [Firmicutes bacterium]|nr:prepilin peptidase [Bacillota bacterium]